LTLKSVYDRVLKKRAAPLALLHRLV
jgi:hypothetical protein